MGKSIFLITAADSSPNIKQVRSARERLSRGKMPKQEDIFADNESRVAELVARLRPILRRITERIDSDLSTLVLALHVLFNRIYEEEMGVVCANQQKYLGLRTAGLIATPNDGQIRVTPSDLAVLTTACARRLEKDAYIARTYYQIRDEKDDGLLNIPIPAVLVFNGDSTENTNFATERYKDMISTETQVAIEILDDGAALAVSHYLTIDQILNEPSMAIEAKAMLIAHHISRAEALWPIEEAEQAIRLVRQHDPNLIIESIRQWFEIGKTNWTKKPGIGPEILKNLRGEVQTH